MTNCVFCKIIKGEIPAAKVYEDENVLAFLDMKPDTPGHSLVIPKRHSEAIFDINPDDLGNVILVAQKIAVRLKDVVGAVAVNVNHNSGAAAGQIVGHFHVHVIGRYENSAREVGSMEEIAKKLAM